ncbi:MAG: DNA primase [Candidatus Gastranaerophilales bacterium]
MVATLEDLITQIKDRLDIVTVVSESVILKKNGNHYWGLCPFHNEKTSSFSVNPKLGIFKCFGCGEGGDALTFIMKTQNRDFMEVITELAERFGLEMPKSFSKNKPKENKEEMIKACTKATEFYNLRLLQDKSTETTNVLKYLSDRGINKDTIEKYSLGYAPNAYSAFHDKYKNDFSDEILEKSGLILKTKDGRYIDRFRNRLIIPIQNENGEYVAFGARAVEKDQMPKYLNSSDSPIYNKSKLLYGLYTAKDAIKAEDSVILMEGYFDVISAQVNDVKNCVASCGTSLTSEHIKLLSRYTNSRKIFLSFDTDNAGLKATDRNAQLIKDAFTGLGDIKQFDESYMSSSDDRYSCEIRVVAPPEGKDPDEFIRSVGADSYKQYMSDAPLLLDFQLNNILKEKKDIKTAIDKTRLVKKIMPVLEEIKNKIIQSEYARIVANSLNIDENALLQELQKNKINSMKSVVNYNKIVTKELTIQERAQKNLLSVFLVENSSLSFQQIKELTTSTEFTDEMLRNIKSTIDKITCSVNNVKELIEKLYTAFIQEPDTQKVITDMISIAETYNNLDEQDFLNVIQENIMKINHCLSEKEKETIRNLYKNANDNETEALKIQMQLRDRINNRLKMEKLND